MREFNCSCCCLSNNLIILYKYISLAIQLVQLFKAMLCLCCVLQHWCTTVNCKINSTHKQYEHFIGLPPVYIIIIDLIMQLVQKFDEYCMSI